MHATGRLSGEAMGTGGEGRTERQGRWGRSVFRTVVARGLVVLAIILALGAIATASLYLRASEDRALSERHLPLFATASRLHANAATLAALSTRVLTVDNRPELATLADRLEAQAAAVAADIDRLEALGLGAEQTARARVIQGELADGADGLLRLTESILGGEGDAERLMGRRDRLIQRQELISSEMITLVTGLSRETERRVVELQEGAVRSGHMLTVVVGIAAGVAVLAVLALYHGLRRHMLDRLLAVTQALRDWRHGGRGDIAVDDRGDEISEMAGALHDLIAAVDRRTQELATQAQTDMLTGMFNRRGFQDRAEAELARSGRYGTELSVLVGDIDHFKLVNDNHGHALGDVALRHVADLWRAVLRDSDVSGRLGGEEFAALLPHTSAAAARVVAERIRADIEGGDIALEDGGALILTISIGVATAMPGEGLGSLLARADTALYAAKRGGRNRVAVSDAALDPLAR
ncbi:diguanylate cyclase [Novispirillum sp. DQ9]|uniref:GGDEF domain-containing protein n=1 Tax=Novispirillum sp. DQ9 TaxID=3398612 RepID=UPI003C7D6828